MINGLKSLERVVFLVTYFRRRTLNALKAVIKDNTLVGPDAVGCTIKVRGVRSGSRRDSGSGVWRSWITD